MANFAVFDGYRVVNVLIADSQEIAESVSGLSAFETTGVPWVGWTMEAEGWRPPSPFASWIWNGSEWEAPVPMPTEGGPWTWDESTLSWVEITLDPEPSAE